ncbi:MAG: endolytic transglycosylase MltG [Bacteroidales bacterium]|nr:endolytic transglycosylase MltG [Bacteroidales bacterium]
MKKTKKILIGIIITSATIILCGAAFVAWLTMDKWDGEEPVRVYVPQGATPEAVRDSLELRLGSYGAKVATLWKWQGGKPETAHGSYVARPGATTLSLSRQIATGRQTPVRVTYNNIRTMPQLADKVASYLEFSPQDFLSACDSVLPSLGYNAPQYISAFVPDTYEFFWTASAPSVVKRLEAERDRFWNQERTDKANALGLDPIEIATVASITEEETIKAEEMPRVARLYLNRLKKGMLLQADPTVKYAVGDFSLRRIGKKQLSVDSPYNTYLYPGLPPGPIRMASQRGIDAVLNAPVHDYLYMCAKEDFSGYHNFARDLTTHQSNARRYQAELNRRGIK